MGKHVQFKNALRVHARTTLSALLYKNDISHDESDIVTYATCELATATIIINERLIKLLNDGYKFNSITITPPVGEDIHVYRDQKGYFVNIFREKYIDSIRDFVYGL